MKFQWDDDDLKEIQDLYDQIGKVLDRKPINIVALALIEHLCQFYNFQTGTTLDPDKLKALLVEKQECGWNITVAMHGEEH